MAEQATVRTMVSLRWQEVKVVYCSKQIRWAC